MLKITIDWKSREATAQTKPKPSRGAAFSELGSILCCYNLFQPSDRTDTWALLYLTTKADPDFQYICVYILFEAEAEARINSTIRVASRLDLRDVIDTHAQLHFLLKLEEQQWKKEGNWSCIAGMQADQSRGLQATGYSSSSMRSGALMRTTMRIMMDGWSTSPGPRAKSQKPRAKSKSKFNSSVPKERLTRRGISKSADIET
jgi:hypothetical protein